MTLYLPTDVSSINLGEKGCGESHDVVQPGGGQHASLDCPQCELNMPAHFGCSPHEASVTPTCDEIAEYERAEKEANRRGTQALAAMHVAAANAIPPGVSEQFAAQLAAMQEQNDRLSAQVAELLAASKTPAPVDPPAESAHAAPAKPARTPKAKTATSA